MTTNQNKSPVFHVEHNLGLESWCIKNIYEYSHNFILEHKKRNKLLSNNNVIIKYLNCAILLNPDMSTFWNIRRQLFEKNKLNITKEFQFSSIVLTKKPKSNETFAYRRWLFSFQSHESIDWNFELSLCSKCSEKTANNYHSWSHRQWVLEKANNLVKFELSKTEKFIRKHIYDYSCYHHRQFVFKKLLESNYSDTDNDEDEDNLFFELKKFVKNVMEGYDLVQIETPDELLAVLLPNINHIEFGNEMKKKYKSFLYCMNLAICDIKLIEELKYMYGDNMAFEYHRRAVLQFFVENCRTHNKPGAADLHQSMPKVLKYDHDDGIFLENIKKMEGRRGVQHRKWCQIFLGFNYTDDYD